MQWVSKILCVLASCCVFSSCIEDYEVDFGKVGNKLSVVSELDPNERVEVLVAIPKVPFQYGHYVTPSDARVIIKEDGQLWDVLTFLSHDEKHVNGVYVSEKMVSPGKKYDIEVQYDEYPTARASELVPTYIEIVRVEADLSYESLKEKTEFPVTFYFRAPVGEKKVYAFRHYFHIRYPVENEMGDVEVRDYWMALRQRDSYKGRNDFRSYRMIEVDDASKVDFELLVNTEALAEFYNLESLVLYTFVEELSASAYAYRQSYPNRNDDNYGELFRVYGNIENGFGLFSSKTSTYYYSVLK